jgi:hypothetical protein
MASSASVAEDPVASVARRPREDSIKSASVVRNLSSIDFFFNIKKGTSKNCIAHEVRMRVQHDDMDGGASTNQIAAGMLCNQQLYTN